MTSRISEVVDNWCKEHFEFGLGKEELKEALSEAIAAEINAYFEGKSIEIVKKLNQKQVAEFEKKTGCLNYFKIGLEEVETELKERLLGDVHSPQNAGTFKTADGGGFDSHNADAHTQEEKA